ncbi:MAG: RnfABCDGE type electron transport complex subunit D [Candidatus Omnitrophica bacterium]|nr:RnfABCDGE type electron transport complex subunit D [Candidatus Omnitrophota bacterium]
MNKFTISASPHIHSPVDTTFMMRGVIKALLPAVIAGVYFFRMYAVGVLAASIAGCVITEWLLRKTRRQEASLKDSSALLTGMLLALVLPPALPLWMAFLGGVVSIALGKEVFGGLGKNVFNPALLGRAFLMAAFPVALTTWTRPVSLDAVTTATPLGLAKFEHAVTPYAQLFLGNVGGCIGETSALALILGILYLLYHKIIDWRVPAAYIGTVALFSGVAWAAAPQLYAPPLFHILAGGLLIGAGFMATDPVTTPVTAKGRWVFGAGCGLITMTIRLWGGLPEGVMYSILCMNAVTPLINRYTRPRRYGGSNGG